MSEKRNTMIPVVHIILEQDGKILLGKRINTGFRDGLFEVPSGHIEEAESPKEAAIREAFEEVGVIINAEDCECVHTLYQRKLDDVNSSDRIYFFFKITKWQNEPVNCEQDKCEALDFYPLDKVPGQITQHILHGLQCIEQQVAYSEFDYEK